MRTSGTSVMSELVRKGDAVDMCGAYAVSGFLLVAFCRRSLWFSITGDCRKAVLLLPVGSSLCINEAWIAGHTLMQFWYIFWRQVITLNMLPCMTIFAEDGVAIIIIEATYAFNCGIVVHLAVNG